MERDEKNSMQTVWPSDDLVVLGMICRYLEKQDSCLRRRYSTQNHNAITNTKSLLLAQVKSLDHVCAGQLPTPNLCFWVSGVGSGKPRTKRGWDVAKVPLFPSSAYLTVQSTCARHLHP